MSSGRRNSTRTQVLYLAWCVCGAATIFSEPLGLTRFVPRFVMVAGGVLLGVPLITSQLLDARRARLSPVAQAESAPASRSRMWIAIVVCAIVSLSGPLWLPLTGGEFAPTSLTSQVISSAVTFTVVTAIILYVFRRSRP